MLSNGPGDSAPTRTSPDRPRRRRRRLLRDRHPAAAIEPLEPRILLDGSRGPIVAPDAFEPNDSISTATDLGRLDALVVSNLTTDTPTDNDYYRVTMATTHELQLDLLFDHGDGNLNLEFYDQNLKILGASSSLTDNEHISVPVAGGETYIIRVFGFSLVANPDYQLFIGGNIDEDQFEPNETRETAVPLGMLGSRVESGLTINRPGDIDWYRIDAADDGLLDIDIFFDHQVGDLDMRLFDETGRLVAQSISETDDESIAINASQGETYFLRVFGFAAIATSESYDLQISGPATNLDRFEHNNQVEEATNLGVIGSRVEDGLSIHDATDEDFFEVTAQAAGTLTIGIDFIHALGDLDMEVFDATRATIGSSASTTDNESVVVPVATGDHYYVRVFSTAGAVNDYDLNVVGSAPAPDRFEANNDFTSATDLGPLTGVLSEPDLSIHAPDDVDFFRQVATMDGVIDVQAQFLHLLGKLSLCVLNGDYHLIDQSLSLDDNEQLIVPVSAGATYYIIVDGFEGSMSADYDLIVRQGPPIAIPSMQVSLAGAPIPDDGTIDFGTTEPGLPLEVTLLITNTGDADLLMGTPRALGNGFSATSPLDAVVAPGGTTTMTVRLDAPIVGTFLGDVIVNANVPDPLNFTVNGVVSGPEIELAVGGDRVEPGVPVMFGTTTLGNPTEVIVTVSNGGDQPLALVDDFDTPAGFFVTAPFGDTTLAPGQTTTFTISLMGDRERTYSGTLRFPSNDANENPFELTVLGTVNGSADEPAILVSSGNRLVADGATGINFGRTRLGDSAVRQFTIRNVGLQPLTLSDPSGLPAGFTATPLSAHTLGFNETATFDMTFDGPDVSIYGGTVTIANNDPQQGTFRFDVSGEVAEPEIEVHEDDNLLLDDGSVVDFGTVADRSTVRRPIIVTNTGTGPLVLGAIGLPDGFEAVGFGAGHLGPGASTTFDLVFHGQSPGLVGGQVSLPNNDADEAPFDFSVQAEVVEHTLEVFHGSHQLYSGLSTLSFDRTHFGKPLSRAITVTNTGAASLTLNEPVTVPAGFIASAFAASSLAPGASTTFDLTAEAGTAGSFAGQVSLREDAVDAIPFVLEIDVQVVAPEIDVRHGGQSLQDGAGNIDFATTAVGTPVARTIQVMNTGTAELVLAGPLALPEGFSTDFTPIALEPGAATSFDVILEATSGGTFGGTMSLANGDVDEHPFDIVVSGTVTAPVLEVLVDGNLVDDGLTIVDFGATIVGAPITLPLVARNAGEGTLTLSNPIGTPTGFSATEFVPASVVAAAQSGIDLTLDATQAGTFSGLVTITHYPGDSPFEFVVTGEVRVPQVAVLLDAVAVANGTGSIGFGTTRPGVAVTRTLEVRNTGDGPLDLGPSFDAPSGFSVSGFGPTTLDPGTATLVDLTLDASTDGAFSGTVSFDHGDGDDPPFAFSVDGLVADGEIELTQNATPILDGVSRVDFPATSSGQPVVLSFTVRNAGPGPLALTDPPAAPAGFEVTSFGATELAAGATTSFDVTFLAEANGTVEGLVSFANSDPDEDPFTFTVGGEVDDSPSPDRFEGNEGLAGATDLGSIAGAFEAALSIHDPDDDDYFRFTAAATGPWSAFIEFDDDQGNLELAVLDQGGDRIEAAWSETDDEIVMFDAVAGRTYFVFVYGRRHRGDLTDDGVVGTSDLGIVLQAFGTTVEPGNRLQGDSSGDGIVGIADLGSVLERFGQSSTSVTQADYSLRLAGPVDRFEPNDSFAAAADLGVLANRVEPLLSIHATGNDDFFRFEAPRTGSQDVRIAFANALGNLDLEVFDASEQSLGASASATDDEQVTFDVVAGQSYFVRVNARPDVADLDNNGVIGAGDLSIVLQNFGQPFGNDPSGDGIMGADDLSTVLQRFTQSSQTTNPRYDLRLSGPPVPPIPEISLSTGATDLRDGISIFDLGSGPRGGTISAIFTVRNDGPGDLSLTEPITVPAGFSVTAFGSTSLAANDTTTFEVSVDTTAAGTFEGAVSFTSNDADESPFDFTIRAEVVAPDIAFFEGPVEILDGGSTTAFGDVPVGGIARRSYVVRNVGSAPLTLSNPVSTPAGFTVSAFTTGVLAPGASTLLHLTVDTSAVGDLAGTVSFTHGDTDESPFDFSVSARVVAPEIEVLEAALSIVDDSGIVDLGSTLMGTPQSTTITVRNTGTAALALPGSLQLPDGFSATGYAPVVLAPDSFTTFDVILDANATGMFEGVASFANTDADEHPFDFTVRGEVRAPEVRLTLISCGIFDELSTIDFGRRLPGMALTRTLTVTNDGMAPLAISNVVVPAGFSSGGFSVSSLDAGASTTFDVTFDAVDLGISAGTVTFTTDDADEGTYSFNVTGEVIASDITVSVGDNDLVDGASEVAYGLTRVGTPVPQTFTVTNDGTAPLMLNGLREMPAGYSAGTFLPTVLEPGGSTQFDLVLDGDVLGVFDGTVSIESGDGDENPFDFQVSGEVGDAEVSVTVDGEPVIYDASEIDFGLNRVGSTLARTFTVTNVGRWPLALGAVTTPFGYGTTGFTTSELASGESTTLDVVFLSTFQATMVGTVSFVNDDADESPFAFSVTGIAADPEITVSVDSQQVFNEFSVIDFGVTRRGTDVTRTFTVTNDGLWPMTLSNPISAPAGFSATPFATTDLAPGASTTFDLTLDGSTTGFFTGDVSIINDDANENPFEFEVISEVAVPEIEVSVDGGDVIDDVSGVSFDHTRLGTDVVKTFTVTNTGRWPLTLTDPITVPAGFSAGPFASVFLDAGASTTFDLTLDGASVGTFGGAVSFVNDDADENPFTFDVFGEVGVPEIEVSVDGGDVQDGVSLIDFGLTRQGTDEVKTFTVTNTGRWPLTLS
ncbi:MAG: hypothetical protein CMJ18_22340, partial [Phycisphaeraceae bacterium]|nr:hypothetical protein [Phycisphaeraceae bacterium]